MAAPIATNYSALEMRVATHVATRHAHDIFESMPKPLTDDIARARARRDLRDARARGAIVDDIVDLEPPTPEQRAAILAWYETNFMENTPIESTPAPAKTVTHSTAEERAIRDVMLQEIKTVGRPARRKQQRPPVKLDWLPGDQAWYLAGPATRGSSMTRVTIRKWNRAHTRLRIDGPGLSNVSAKPSHLHTQLS